MVSAKQYSASVRNLRHARAQKKRNRLTEKNLGKQIVRKGGFLPANFSLRAFVPPQVEAIHKGLQAIKPVSLVKNIGDSFGISLPKGKFGDALRSIGKFAIDKLGYGMVGMVRKRKAKRRKPRARVLRIM